MTMVLVDTPVWSLALRRKPGDLTPREQALTQALAELVREGRAQIVGVVRQELLSGLREADRFDRLRDYLRAFEEPKLDVRDYEEAAQMDNRCRTKGIAGSAIDFLICAVAQRRKWQVFTTDWDFERYGKVLAVRLYGAA
jgi:predicted nucleic acid-binding protein